MRKGMWIIVFIILQLIKMITASLIQTYYGDGRIEVSLKEPITYERLKFQSGYQKILPVVGDKQVCFLWNNQDKKQEVRGIGTNWRMAEGAPLKMVDGAFWGEKAVSEGRNVVVIGDRLAKRLFDTDKVKGNTCKIDDISYQIVGVYQCEDTWQEKLFGTGADDVYFPITSGADQKNGISHLIIMSNPDEEKQENAKCDAILLALGINAGESIIYDGSDHLKRLYGLCDLSLTLLGIIIILRSIRPIYHCMTKIKEGGWQVLCSLLVMDGLAAIFLIRHIYIPKGFLPPYNIFDITHYIRYFEGRIQLHNQMMGQGFSEFEPMYWLISKWSILLTMIQGAASIKAAGAFYKGFMGVINKNAVEKRKTSAGSNEKIEISKNIN